MTRYLAWYNGSTTITLTGNSDECPDETQGPMSNALGIGGMTVPGNETLDRTTYDKNPFYFWMPYESTPDIGAQFQSSTDYYIDETQSWTLSATKSGDGYDVSGYWIGTLPSVNSYGYSTTKCWQGGDFWPNTYTKSSGEHEHWNLTGRLTPESATFKFDLTWITSDEIEWHVIIEFEGNAYTDGPRLVTDENAPTTKGVLGGESESESSNDDSSSATSTASSGSSSAATSTSSSGSSSSATSASNSGSSVGAGSKMGDWKAVTVLVGLVASFISAR